MPLIVIRKTAIIANVEVVLRRTEKRVARVVDRFGKRVGEAAGEPSRHAILQGNGHPVVVRITLSAVLRDVAKARIRAAEVHRILSGGQRRNVQVALHDDVNASRMEESERAGYPWSDFPFDLQVRLKTIRVPDIRIDRGQIEQR